MKFTWLNDISDLTLSGFADWLAQAFLIMMAIILVLMIFYGLAWYFFKIWNTKEDANSRAKIHASARWMILSWFGLLTIEIIALVLYISFV